MPIDVVLVPIRALSMPMDVVRVPIDSVSTAPQRAKSADRTRFLSTPTQRTGSGSFGGGVFIGAGVAGAILSPMASHHLEIPLSRPDIGPLEEELVLEVLQVLFEENKLLHQLVVRLPYLKLEFYQVRRLQHCLMLKLAQKLDPD